MGGNRARKSQLPIKRERLNGKEGFPYQSTPIKYEMPGKLLWEDGYDEQKTTYLVNGIREGFKLRLDRTIQELSQQQLDRGQQTSRESYVSKEEAGRG